MGGSLGNIYSRNSSGSVLSKTGDAPATTTQPGEKKQVLDKKESENKDAEKLQKLRYVNLRESYSEALLSRFYNDLMKKNFPIEDELEPLETWISKIDPAQASKLHANDYIFNVLLALDPTNKIAGTDDEVIAGGIVFEYYKQSNCALITYFVVETEYRRGGLVKLLIQRALPILNQASLKNVNKSCDLILAETNATGVEDGVMESTVRHKIMQRLGFMELKFEYTQPPLDEEMDPVFDLLLICHELSPAIITRKDGKKVVPVEKITGFLNDFAHACVGYSEEKSEYEEAAFFIHEMKQFKGTSDETIDLNAILPWSGPHAAPPGILKRVKEGEKDQEKEKEKE